MIPIKPFEDMLPKVDLEPAVPRRGFVTGLLAKMKYLLFRMEDKTLSSEQHMLLSHERKSVQYARSEYDTTSNYPQEMHQEEWPDQTN